MGFAMMLRALIVDDEPIARKVLREELELQPDIVIVGEADTGVRALEQTVSLRPHLVFLDLQMPEMGGFEFIRKVPRAPVAPAIIVVTAYHLEAIAAFDAGGIDYLLKPVGGSSLLQSLDRVRELLSSRVGAAESLAKLQQIAQGQIDVALE
jgi:YesN/AraC family two-component response regulator